MNADPQAVLRAIRGVVGVRGALISDARGAILAASIPAALPADQLERAVQLLMTMLQGLGSAGRGKPVDLDLVFNEGRWVVRGLPDGFLSLLCNRKVNLALLHQTVERSLQTRRALLEGRQEAQVGRPDVEVLKQVAADVLGEHAGKVIAMLDAAGDSLERLQAACKEAEQFTRLFIDKKKAHELAERFHRALD